MKSSVRGMSGGTDGEGGGIALDIDPYTVYANPYFVATHYQETVEATKHYYMGSQRVSSEMTSEPFVRAGGPQDVPEGPLAPEDMDPAFQDLLLLLEGFGKEQGEDYDLDEMAGMPSYETLHPESEFNDATSECYDDRCFCEMDPYWSEEKYANDCEGIGVLYWYHPDYLGNTQFITDHAGEPYQFFFYSPWGEALVDQHSSNGSYDTPFRFNGKELDAETGNYYYGARYYDPRVSVWLSVDQRAHWYPGTSPYAYVMNNPVNLIDPTGMSATGPDGDPKKAGQRPDSGTELPDLSGTYRPPEETIDLPSKPPGSVRGDTDPGDLRQTPADNTSVPNPDKAGVDIILPPADIPSVLIPKVGVKIPRIATGVATSTLHLLNLIFLVSGDSRLNSYDDDLIYTVPDPTGFPAGGQYRGDRGGGAGGPDWLKWLAGGSLAAGTALGKHKYNQLKKDLEEKSNPQDNTRVAPHYPQVIKPSP